MRFLETKLPGAWLIEPEPIADHRGHFMRTFCAREFADRGLASAFPQHSLSATKSRGSIRGMHFQRAPHTEVKVVGCAKGAMLDVIIDLRVDSPTHGKWQGFELTAANGHQLYIPAGFAHGFLVLSAMAEFTYKCTDYYDPASERTLIWNDPQVGIRWPLPAQAAPGLSARARRHRTRAPARSLCDRRSLDHVPGGA